VAQAEMGARVEMEEDQVDSQARRPLAGTRPASSEEDKALGQGKARATVSRGCVERLSL
jgi:hypothetical protein